MPNESKKARENHPPQRVKRDRKKPKLVNPKRLLIAIVTGIFILYFIYIMIWQQIVITRKNNEIEALEEKIGATAQQTERLEKELENLNDPEYLEKIAREKLGLVRPNERVFVDANKSDSNQSD